MTLNEIANNMYRILLYNSRRGKIQMGYNELCQELRIGNMRKIHNALGKLLADGRIKVIKNNTGRGSKYARTYGVVEIMKLYGEI